MKTAIDITGQKFGRLTVLKRNGESKNGMSLWLCVCECGRKITTRSNGLRSGRAKSCGCHRKDRMKTLNLDHGLRNHYIYNIWRGIKKRCYNKKHKSYNDYGGRGITMAPEWLDDIVAFYNHVGERPSSTHQIDRENNNGNYVPGNVRWVTPKVNSNNRRKSKRP